MTNNKIFFRSIVLFVTLFIAYSLSWFYFASFAKNNIFMPYLQQIGGKNNSLTYKDIKLEGFPFSIKFRIITPKFVGINNMSVETEDLLLCTAVFTDKISLIMPKMISITSDNNRHFIASDSFSVFSIKLKNSLPFIIAKQLLSNNKKVDLDFSKFEFKGSDYKIENLKNNVKNLIAKSYYHDFVVNITDNNISIEMEDAFELLEGKISDLGKVKIVLSILFSNPKKIEENRVIYTSSKINNFDIDTKIFSINANGFASMSSQKFVFSIQSYPKFINWLITMVEKWQVDFITKIIKESADFDNTGQNITLRVENGLFKNKKSYQELVKEYTNEYLKKIMEKHSKPVVPGVSNKIR